MVEKLARLTADQRSNFVAYLDGELSEQETQQIERLLSQNEVARHDMESLATVWEVLDTLPRTKAPEDFAQKTIATLKMDEQQTPLSEQAWFQKAQEVGSRVLGWCLVIACGFVGFALMRSFPPSTTEALIENYPVLEQFDSYQEIGSVEFLKKLQSSPEWLKHNQENGEAIR